VLQVSPLAEEAVVQAAYRALARVNHPDLNPDESAVERMRELNEAYDLLSDPRRRAVYDLSLNQQRTTEVVEDPQRIRRRTACWRCRDPLESGFSRYCGECHWIICEICRGCGCSHPNRLQPEVKKRRRAAAWAGWTLA